jgi:O-antigen/teichoic acid export membrane protein
MSAPSVISGKLSEQTVLGLQGKPTIQSTLRRAYESAGSSSGLIALCDQGIVSVTNFATAVIIGRVCGKTDLGVYTLVWTLVTMATGVFATLITTPYTVFSPQLHRSRRRRYLGSILVHHLVLSILLTSTMAAGAALSSWRGWLSNSTSNVVTTSAAIIVFIGLREFIRNVSFAELRSGWALSVDLIACFTQAVGMFLLFHFGKLTASRIFTVLGISSAVAAVGWLAFRRRAFCFDKRLFVPDLKRNWALAKWVLGSGILWQVTGYLFPWVLAAFHGAAVTGTWAACCGIVALGNPVLLGLSNCVLPRISARYAEAGIVAMKRYVHYCSLLFMGLLLPVVLTIAAFGERIITFVYGKAYSGTAVVLTLLALSTLIITLAKPYSQGLFSLECAKADTLVNGLWVSLLFIVGIPAVRSYSAVGAAAAFLVCSAIAAAIRIRVFSREVRRP